MSSVCATIGASSCYGLSFSLAREIVLNRFPKKIVSFNTRIRENKNHLFYYMLTLRFTPLVPNIVINVASPIVGLPFKYFFFATLFGLMPNNILLIKTGLTLSDLNDFNQSNMQNLGILLVISGLSLIPTFIKRRMEKNEKNPKKEWYN